MNRKTFLSSLTAAGIVLPALALKPGKQEADTDPVLPPYLKAGDTIGITCPAGFITEKEIEPAVKEMQSWGFKVKVGSTVGKRDFTYGGTDAERANDLQAMMDDDQVQAIMCARGGYGAVRIIDRVNFESFSKSPKWIIGFSDITVIHSHLIRNYGIASIHSKMCNSFPDDMAKAEAVQVESIHSIGRALKGEELRYTFPAQTGNRIGEADGILTGGNLKTLESLSGSRTDIKTTGRILFVEDTGEYLYSIDRMFWNLQRTGKLAGLKGLIVGGFKVKGDDPGEEFGKTVQDIVLEKVKDYSYPVCFEFPVGHQKYNVALKCGVRHQLMVKEGECILTSMQ
ncbi:MAG: LD-carboxypeptidase [Bacteroidetes bacterium]|nr:LD-carboxypeptidase [Bacteroidota bacterium]